MEIIIPLILSSCGMVMISSLSLRNNMAGGNPYGAPLRQFQFIGVGLTFMMICLAMDSSTLKKRKSDVRTESEIGLFERVIVCLFDAAVSKIQLFIIITISFEKCVISPYEGA